MPDGSSISGGKAIFPACIWVFFHQPISLCSDVSVTLCQCHHVLFIREQKPIKSYLSHRLKHSAVKVEKNKRDTSHCNYMMCPWYFYELVFLGANWDRNKTWQPNNHHLPLTGRNHLNHCATCLSLATIKLLLLIIKMLLSLVLAKYLIVCSVL